MLDIRGRGGSPTGLRFQCWVYCSNQAAQQEGDQFNDEQERLEQPLEDDGNTHGLNSVGSCRMSVADGHPRGQPTGQRIKHARSDADVLGMNTAFCHSIAFAFLLLWQAAACGLLLLWLWRHRSVKVPFYRGARLEATEAASMHHPRAKPEWVRKKVLYLASHLDSCRQVAHAFNRSQGCWAHVGKTFAWEVMRDNAEEIRQLGRERKRRQPRFIPVNHTWALDLTFYRSPYGATFTILGIIDAGSRNLLALRVLPTKCAFAILGYLLLAFSRYGLPVVSD